MGDSDLPPPLSGENKKKELTKYAVKYTKLLGTP